MKNSIRIKARIELLPAAEGGRTGPVRGSYRPNHNFGDAENRQMDIGYIDFPEGQSLLPGQSREINVTFFFRPELEEVLSPGRRWRIQEGAHLVGYGTVLDVIT